MEIVGFSFYLSLGTFSTKYIMLAKRMQRRPALGCALSRSEKVASSEGEVSSHPSASHWARLFLVEKIQPVDEPGEHALKERLFLPV